MSDEYNEWETTTGVEDIFDAEVIDARFDDGDYGVQLVLTLDNGQSEFDKYWSCGGKAVFQSEAEVDMSGLKGNTFHKRSAAGELIESLRDHPEVLKQIANNGSPKVAKSWIGLKARWQNVEKSAQIEGETRKFERLLVVGSFGGEGAPERKGVEPEKWLVELCVSSETYDEFMDAALADERLDAGQRKLVLNESYWDFAS